MLRFLSAVLAPALLLPALLLAGCAREAPPAAPFTEWRVTGGDPGITHYAAHTQITPENVAGLKPVWTHRSGSPANVQCNPIIIDGTLYFTTGLQELVALDAATGEERWRYRPTFDRIERPEFNHVNRGLAYRREGRMGGTLYYVSGGLLNAVDAGSGKPALAFGDSGRVDLNAGHHLPASRMGLTSSASPVVFEDLVIVGSSSWAASGNVSAYDAHTGARRWKFNTIPGPGEEGYETFADTSFWRTGAGINVWGGLSVDEANGLVFFGTGQPKADFYRPGNAGAHLYGNSVVALHAATGKRAWHYQVIHHDLWDMDVPAAPVLSELTVNGAPTPVAIQITKTGNTFIFNRLTGALLSKVEERPVPASKLYGETSYPTQPFVTWPEPFSKQEATLEDATSRTPAARADALARLKRADLSRFAPPSERGLIYYGLHGGGEWGGPAYDPVRQILYVNANEIAWDIRMVNVNDPARRAGRAVHPGEQVYMARGCVSCHGAGREGMENIPALTDLRARYEPLSLGRVITKGQGAMPGFPSINNQELQELTGFLLGEASAATAAASGPLAPAYAVQGYNRFVDADGYPATAPPWGTLTALDLKTGKIVWRRPLGVYPELEQAGLAPTGTENFGGPLLTAGGVLFIGATRDERFRAFEAATGKLLWEYQLPFGGYATPATYVLDGKQYVVIAATGGGKLGTPVGDAMVAFALP